MGEEVKLFGVHGSSYSCRIEIALKLKGIQYEFIQEDLRNKSPLLLKYNPVYKKIPILLHNGKPICESIIILEYIEENWKVNPILPHDPYERAYARFWAKFIDDTCFPALWEACWGKGEEREKAIEEANKHLKTLEDEIKGKKFFGGDSIGLVDIVGTFIAHWLGIIEEVTGIKLLTKEKYPNICVWVDELVNIGVVKEHLTPREYLLAYGTKLVLESLQNS